MTDVSAAMTVGSFEVMREGEIKQKILDTLLRKVSVWEPVRDLEEDNPIQMAEEDVNRLVEELDLSFSVIEDICHEFLRNLLAFRYYAKNASFQWGGNLQRLRRIHAVLLRKIHRAAPVFDYPRAKDNAEILIAWMNTQTKQRPKHFPKLSTQIAIVLFVTDFNDINYERNNKLIQKNILAITTCSAYAFHTARGILEIDKILGR